MIHINGRPYGWASKDSDWFVSKRHCCRAGYQHKTVERIDADEPRVCHATLAAAALECAFIATLPEDIPEGLYARRMREFDVCRALYRAHGRRALTPAQAVKMIDRMDERQRKTKGRSSEHDGIRVDTLVEHGLLRWSAFKELRITDGIVSLFAAHKCAAKDDGVDN